MKNASYCWISISGLSFWFFLGFPFANYQESYGWLAQINTLDLSDFIFKTIGHYSSYRPLGQGAALFLYRFFGDSISSIQFFNYCITVISLFIIIIAIKEKRIITLSLLIAGSFFFSSFGYLFHLHGVFYSPLLLLIGSLIYYYEKPWASANIVRGFVLTIFVSLFHPFAICIYLFYLIGLSLEKRQFITPAQYVLVTSFIIMGLVTIKILVPDQSIHIDTKTMRGILNIYQSMENNLSLSIISFLLSALTLASIKTTVKLRKHLMIGIIFLSLLFYFKSIPIIFVWIISSLLKTIITRKWTMTFLVLVTSLFPLFTGIGSPHLIFLIVVVSALSIPIGGGDLEDKLLFINKSSSFAFTLILLSVFFLLKQDIHIPVISKLAHPLLSEKEKSFQLKNVVGWLMKSEYKGYGLNLVSSSSKTLKSGRIVTRKQKVPTTNDYLNSYLGSLRPSINEKAEKNETLYVCFGDYIIENAKLLYSVKGEYSGNASVFLPSD